ncbi:DNA-binding transcriptional LysR family regulator [Actinokineospora cianjurensis]|uniref:DNA-binding transcriptional LysR family regulator n=1 Tax=Actinokineospora cianjurensis TaxID=585224 RepID=A0A421B208_9PSEU|nr:DNA-binding transcriptional LysR family regulator [Actinokineospora cianjurensis]
MVVSDRFPGTEKVRSFLVLADELHFGRAARYLHLSQPALSQQIAAFEREIGLRLFHRSTRQVRLTEAGRDLLAVATSAISVLDTGLADVRRRAGAGRPQVRIGHVGWGTGQVIARAARVLAPEPVQLVPTYTNFGNQLNQLRHGQVDTALLWRPYLPKSPGDVEEATAAVVPTCLVVPWDHALAGRSSVAVAEVGAERLIRIGVEDAFPVAGMRFVEHTADYAVDTLAAVAAGVGLALCPRLAEWDAVHRDLRFIPIEGAESELVVAWRSTTDTADGSAVHRAVRGLCQAGRETAAMLPHHSGTAHPVGAHPVPGHTGSVQLPSAPADGSAGLLDARRGEHARGPRQHDRAHAAPLRRGEALPEQHQSRERAHRR